MNTVILAFYKGIGRPWDWLVRAVTFSKYSHVEILLPGKVWLSSSPRDGGVRMKSIDPDSRKWDIVSVQVSHNVLEKWNSVPWFAKYDWLGAIASPFYFFRVHHRNRWFCSELAAWYLDLDKPWRYTPGRLYRKLRKDHAATRLQRVPA